MFDALRHKLAQWLVPPKPNTHSRMYSMARTSRLTDTWGASTTSEDTELVSSLYRARARSRQLVRDDPFAQRGKVIVQNNVVGAGIGMQAQVMTSRDQLNQRVNDDIETVWERWCHKDSCHTGRGFHFADLEKALVGQVFDAGEVFIRTYRERIGDSDVPFALELIEAERIADQFQPMPVAQNARVRLGVEIDTFGAPVAYWIRNIHPGELQMTLQEPLKIERVPAEQIIHLRRIDRWPQTRAMPWMHAGARILNDMNGLSEAEITAARAAACYMGFIQSPSVDSDFGETKPDGTQELTLEPAVVERLLPGETFNYAAPNRPNAQLEPFMRMMQRAVAAAIGCSYESLSRDYSQSNYSASRLALIDDRDLWRTLQLWFIRSFRQIIHQQWLQQAVLSRAITTIGIGEYATNREKFEAVLFKPRGWSWVDPVKEVDAYREAVRSGFTTVSAVIAMTGDGRDLEDVLKERRNELDRMKEADLLFDTDPAVVAAPPRPTGVVQPSETPPSDSAATDTAVKTAEKMLRQAGRSHDE